MWYDGLKIIGALFILLIGIGYIVYHSKGTK